MNFQREYKFFGQTRKPRVFFLGTVLRFREDHADDGEFLVYLVLARDDFALDNFAVEFLHEELELGPVET